MSVIPIKDTLKYINQARTNPSAFAQYVKKELNQFINNTTLPLYPGCNYSTNEGKSAWNEAYQFLIKQKPLPAYELNEGLNLAAEDHAIDLAKNNIFGHNSSDGRSFSDRISKRCGKAFGSSGENIGSDFKVQGRDHALQTVLGLIIDDGVSSRGHRKNIFSTDFKFIGIASRVQNDKITTVMDFHSQNLPTISGTANTNNAGGTLKYEQAGNKKEFGGFESNMDDFGGNMGGFGGNMGGFGGNMGGFGGNMGGFGGGQIGMKMGFGNGGNFGGGQMLSGGQNGGRFVVSKSTNTKTSTKNGVKTVVKTTKIKYSDGTEQQEVQQSTSH